MNMLQRFITLCGCLVGLGPISQAWIQTPAPVDLPASQWNAIRSAIEVDLHSATEVLGGLEAFNPGQDWLMTFDGQGFLVRPRQGDWVWGLKLQSYGFAQNQRAVKARAIPRSDGNRITCGLSQNLEEWYINDSRGLEHGYTVQDRPTSEEGERGSLNFDLAIRGSLRFEIHPSGKGVDFLEESGRAALTYAGLHVFDALGAPQHARFERHGELLRISIEESKAVYPLTIDPVAQQAYLKASNTDSFDYFGSSVSISGDTVVVGSPGESSSGAGVNGNQADNSMTAAGAAYVFVRNGSNWSQQAYLKSSHPDLGDDFGRAVAIDGDRIVIGAPYEDSAIGINGDGANNGAPNSGAAYVFERVGTTWSQRAILKGVIPGLQDHFGTDVAVQGDRIVVTAKDEDSNATGVGGNPGNNAAQNSGAAHVFEFSGGAWSQTAYLKASNTEAGDQFGFSVALEGHRIVVGAPHEDSTSNVVNGSQSNNSEDSRGAAYLFEFNGSSWAQQAYLKGRGRLSPGWDPMLFGSDVDLSATTIAIGAPWEDSRSTGVNGNPNSFWSRSRSGAVFLFTLQLGAWSESTYIKASNSYTGGLFGSGVAIDGSLIFVGSAGERSVSAGINGSQQLLGGQGSGAAYSFVRTPTSWRQDAFIKQTNPDRDDSFGSAISLSGDYGMIGAPRESSSSSGVNGDESDNSALDSGATYAIHLEAPVGIYCNPGVANSTGFPASISYSGSLAAADNNFSLQVTDLPQNQTAYFLSSRGISHVSQPGGSNGDLCLGGNHSIGRHNRSGEVRNSGASGIANLTLDLLGMPLQQAVVAGSTWNFQCWHRDSGTSNFSDVISVRFE